MSEATEAQFKSLFIVQSEDTEIKWQMRKLIEFLLTRYERITGVQDSHLYKNLQTLQEKLRDDLAELDEYRLGKN